jgi:pilus assembly protein CpaE
MNAIAPVSVLPAVAGGRTLLANAASDRTAGMLEQAFARRGWTARPHRGSWRDLLPAIAGEGPSLMLIADISGDANPLAAFEEIVANCPDGAAAILIGDRDDARLCRLLLTGGADDYLVDPFTDEDLDEAIEAVLAAQADTPPDNTAKAPAENARIIAVTGARGGVGATTIAVNLAWHLAHAAERKVALVDLDIGFGSAALALDLEAGRGLEEALANPERIDGLFLERAMVKASDNLAILGGGETDGAEIYEATGLRALLEQLSAGTDDIILDLPRHGRVLRDAAFEVADRTLIVSDLSIAGLRDSVRLKRAAAQLGKGEVGVVINRQGARRKGEMPAGSFARGIEADPMVTIPEDPRIAEAGMAGLPLAKQPGARKAAQRFGSLADALSPGKPSKPGLAARLFGRRG